MATERLQFEISENGARTVKSNIDSIGSAARTAHGPITALKSALALVGVGLGLREAIKTIEEMSGKMALLKGITGASSEQMKILGERATKLSEQFGTSTANVIGGMIQLQKTSQDTGEVLEASLNLAQIAQTDAATAATVLGKALAAFGEDTKEATGTVDLFSEVIKNSTLGLEEISAALGRVAPSARSAGVGMKETTALLVALSKGGANSRAVIQDLSQAFDALERPTVRDAAVLRSFGVDLDKVRPSAVGVTAALEELRDKGATGLEELKVSGGQAIDELIRRLPDLEQVKAKFDESDGSAGRFAKTMDESLPAAMERLKAALERLVLSFGGEKGLIQVISIAEKALNQIGATISGVTNVIENYGVKGRTAGELFMEGMGEALKDRTIDAVIDKERADQEAKWKPIGAQAGKGFKDGLAEELATIDLDEFGPRGAGDGFPARATPGPGAAGPAPAAPALSASARKTRIDELRKPLTDFIELQKQLDEVNKNSIAVEKEYRRELAQGIGDQKKLTDGIKEEVLIRDEARKKLAQAVIDTQSFQAPLDVIAAKFQVIDTSVGALAASIGDGLVNAIDRASFALADFAISGFRNVEDLRTAFSNLLKDLGREILALIIKFLILKAIQTGLSAVGGGGGSVGAFVGAQLGEQGSGAAAGKAAGGPLTAGEPAVVGENGPELFVPREAGSVVPAGRWEGGGEPVNVTVVNVTDKDQMLGALQTPAGERVVMNVLNKNKRTLQNLG